MAAVEKRDNYRYLIVRPENGGFGDIARFLVLSDKDRAAKFIESSYDDVVEEELVDDGGGSRTPPDHRWVIMVSIIVRKVIGMFGKPMEWSGYFVEFLLNLLSLNGNLPGLLFNLLRGKVVMPQRGTENFISAIGHLDGRIDLYNNKNNNTFSHKGLPIFDESTSVNGEQLKNQHLMDLSMMASKLAYENAIVVQNVVNLHWKMHFVDFYNCWNDYQKERSTQVFIACDRSKDANLILISFRGTEPFDADDWCTDFDYSWYEIPELGKVHMGFLEALGLGNRTDTSTFHELLQTTNSTINAAALPEESESESEGPFNPRKKKILPEMVEKTAYYVVKSKLKGLLLEHKNAKFIVTGHSLGGALAILFPTVLVFHEEKEIMERLLCVYTYGQPRIGNRQLGRFMESHLEHPDPKYFRVVYCNDLVPRLPYDDKTFLFKHFGFCLYFNSLYVDQKVDEEPNRNFYGMRYLIPEYVNAVWELIRSMISGYIYGPEYKEGWLSMMLRIIGLVLPGVSAHSPTNYVNSVRLGRERTIQMSSLQ